MTDNDKLARRKLLKLGGYAAPVVLGTLLYSGNASAQAASCGPSSCSPNGAPCGPNSCKPRPAPL